MKMQVFKKYKMKKLRYYITFACVALSVICFSACDVLDKKPLDNISDATVWNDEVLIDADITGSYAKTTVLTNEADAVVLSTMSATNLCLLQILRVMPISLNLVL